MSLIVIVDDQVTNRTIYSKLAETIGEGVEVRSFGDPCEALEWVGQNRPDLIVTDHDMPKINGEQFISRFRALPHSAAVPIMMITVNAQRMLRLRALESGATDFLNSPIDHYEFLSRARNLLKLRRGAAETGGEARREAAPPAGQAAVAESSEAEAPASAETSQFLAQCGEAGSYALHVVEIEESGPAQSDSVIAETLRRQLRSDDLVACIDRRRFAILQRNVVDPADANACASRLLELRKTVGVLQIGTSLPRAEAGAPENRAAARLSEAAALARKRDARLAVPATPDRSDDIWRFQPRIDLRSGEVRGAQALRDDDPADARDSEALRAVLACASALRSSLRRPFSLSLRLRIGQAGAAATALLLAPLLAEARLPPSWLDVRICAQEALAERMQAEDEARGLKALGVGLTLDLAALAPYGLRGDDAWTAPLGAFVAEWRPVLKFPCGDKGAIALARFLRRQAGPRAEGALLLADGVASSALLRPLLRAGVSQAQGGCFGAPFSARDLKALLGAEPDADGPGLAMSGA